MTVEAIYHYPNVKDEPRIRKLRLDGKRFRMQSAWFCNPKVCGCRRGHHWRYGITDARFEWSTRAIYRLPEVVAALKVDVPVLFVEGERDADTAVSRWGMVATSIWQGSNGLNVDQAAWFTKYDTQSEVLLMLDLDGPGAWSGFDRYTTLLDVGVPARRIEVLAPPRRFVRGQWLNDLSDAAEAGLGLSDMRRVDLGRLRDAAEAYGAARAARYSREPVA